MNPFEMVVLIIAIVTVGRIITARHGGGRNRSGSEVAHFDPDTDRMRDEIKQLKERIAVLERLATDGSNSLDREIEKLRDR